MINWAEVDIVARTIWGEARGEPRLGRLAVAWVIQNRYDSNKWFSADTYAGVVIRDKQFSCWNAGDPNKKALIEIGQSDAGYQTCVHAAIGAMQGIENDPTGGATHYHTPSVFPPWSRGQRPTAEIGNHVFYKGIN